MANQDSASEEAKIRTILDCFPHDQSLEDLVLIPRFRQRFSILSEWSIPPGSKILDIGCGQGDSTLVLALGLGPDCHITGIDTAPDDYGTPRTVSESQGEILKSVLGDRVSFYNQTDAATFFQSPAGSGVKFNAATACHSLFYFPDPAAVASFFFDLKAGGITKVYVAEYDQKQTTFPKAQTPHILAAKAQALYHAYKAEADAAAALAQNEQAAKNAEMPLNVRAAPDVESITRAAKEAGFKITREGRFTPKEEYIEGHLETRYTKGERFEKRVREERFGNQKEEEILGVVKEVRKAWEEMEREGVEKVRCMDVWWGVFELE